MSTNNPSQWLVKMALAGVLVVMPLVAQAQSSDATRGVWMAASSDEASLTGRGFGRLTITDGRLAFQSANYEWRLELSEVERIGRSKVLDNALEVESVTGQVYYVAILDARLTPTAPGKAAQAIAHAVATAPAPAVPARAVIAAAGGGGHGERW